MQRASPHPDIETRTVENPGSRAKIEPEILLLSRDIPTPGDAAVCVELQVAEGATQGKISPPRKERRRDRRNCITRDSQGSRLPGSRDAIRPCVCGRSLPRHVNPLVLIWEVSNGYRPLSSAPSRYETPPGDVGGRLALIGCNSLLDRDPFTVESFPLKLFERLSRVYVSMYVFYGVP